MNTELFYVSDPSSKKCDGKASKWVIEKVKQGIKRSGTVSQKIIKSLEH